MAENHGIPYARAPMSSAAFPPWAKAMDVGRVIQPEASEIAFSSDEKPER